MLVDDQQFTDSRFHGGNLRDNALSQDKSIYRIFLSVSSTVGYAIVFSRDGPSDSSNNNSFQLSNGKCLNCIYMLATAQKCRSLFGCLHNTTVAME